MRRGLVPVLLVLVVALAGCNGFALGGDGTPTETVTPAAVPTDRPTPAEPQYPPGLTDEGVANASALFAAHASALGNQSFSVRTHTTVIAPNGSVLFETTRTLRAGPPGAGVSSVTERHGTVGGLGARAAPITTTWSNGTATFSNRTYANGTTTYDRVRTGPDRRAAAKRALAYTIEPLDTQNTSVRRLKRNDTTRYLVRGRMRGGGFGGGNVSLQLIADSSGLVDESRTVTGMSSENVSRIVSETRFSKVGTTEPHRPSWVGAAENRTTPVPATVTPNPTAPRNYPPGIARVGIENAIALVAAHASALGNRSFVRRSNDTSLTPNGSVLARSTSTVRAGPPGEGFSLVIEENGTDGYLHEAGAPVRTAYWSDGDRVFGTERYANGTTTRRRLETVPAVFRRQFVRGDLYLLDSFGVANTTVAERTTGNETTLYDVRGNARTEEWRRIDLRALVDTRGVVHRVDMVRTASATNDAPKVVTNTRFFEVGTTDAPDPPAWVETTRNRTATTDRTEPEGG